MRNDYLERILKARVYDVAVETPLEVAPNLSARLGNRLMLKREDMQPVFSFKCRGAYNKMANLSAAPLARGVIASSAGNHAQGWRCRPEARLRAVIVMPSTTPRSRSMRSRLAEPKCTCTATPTMKRTSRRSAWLSTQARLRSPLRGPGRDRWPGHDRMEILRQTAHPIHAVFVPIGGGGLVAGIAAYIKRLRPAIKVVGVEPVTPTPWRVH